MRPKGLTEVSTTENNVWTRGCKCWSIVALLGGPAAAGDGSGSRARASEEPGSSDRSQTTRFEGGAPDNKPAAGRVGV